MFFDLVTPSSIYNDIDFTEPFVRTDSRALIFADTDRTNYAMDPYVDIPGGGGRRHSSSWQMKMSVFRDSMTTQKILDAK